MKNFYSFVLSVGLTFIAIENSSAATLSVNVKNVASNKGMVLASLCDKETFLKKCLFTATEKANGELVILNFKDVPPGTYALNAYHDENDNKKLDRSIIGIPEEGYAFSRDARGRRGPPTFEDASFEIKEGKNEITITLNY